ncbi:MAG: aldo/keto reductase [Pseudomonadota bacterium]
MSFPADPIALKSGVTMPSLGLGTWRLGERPALRASEIAAVRRAVEIGVRHIDTAEMYGEGACETLLGEALAPFSRDKLFVVSKFYPWNAGRDGMVRACEASLRRLKTEYLDLYLLHWPANSAFQLTLEGAEALMQAGKIRSFGVSNIDAAMMSGLIRSGLDETVMVNQVMFNPARRGIEVDLLPMMDAAGIATVAYTPLEPALLSQNADFAALASGLGLSVAGLSLAWHMTRRRAVPIPKAAQIDHVEALVEAAGVHLDPSVLVAIDRIFPVPERPQPLDIL